MSISIQQRGQSFICAIKSMAVAGLGNDPSRYARATYGERVAAFAKSVVDPVPPGPLADPVQQEFWPLVTQAAIVGKMQGLRVVPLNVRTARVSTGATGYWVAAGQPKPLSKIDFLGSVLPVRKVAGLIAFTKELVHNTSSESEARFRDDVIQALVEMLDASFIDVNSAGVLNEQPASITSGVTPIVSTGNPGSDIRNLIEGFSGDLASASFVCDPLLAAELALARDSGGAFQFPDCSPKGGSLLGLPLICSRSSPRDSSGGQLALIDASGIAYGSAGVKVRVSDVATLSMRDDPSSPIEQVSLFQTDSVALLCEMDVNWEVQRAGSVSVVTGVSYPTEAP